MSRFGWDLPPGVSQARLDREAERLEDWEAHEYERELDAIDPDEPPCDAPRPLEPLEAELDFGGYVTEELIADRPKGANEFDPDCQWDYTGTDYTVVAVKRLSK